MRCMPLEFLFSYRFAFLHRRQQMTTNTSSIKHTDDMDQNAICKGESGSHQN
jgi:hypothetical protein